MTCPKAFLVLTALVLPSSASPQTPEFWALGSDTLAFHEDLFREQRIEVEPLEVSDAEIFVEMIGFQNRSKINALKLVIVRSLGLNNAAAVFHNGLRAIIYDPNWASRGAGGRPTLEWPRFPAESASPEFYLALGHEAGHHLCEHTIGKVRDNPWDTELEADRFGGASVKRFEIYQNRSLIKEVMAAAASKYPQSGSRSHPPRALRLEAIRKGYNEGSPCGNLAPALQVSGSDIIFSGDTLIYRIFNLEGAGGITNVDFSLWALVSGQLVRIHQGHADFIARRDVTEIDSLPKPFAIGKMVVCVSYEFNGQLVSVIDFYTSETIPSDQREFAKWDKFHESLVAADGNNLCRSMPATAAPFM